MPLTLTQLARKALEFYFQDKEFIPDEQTKIKYKEKQACFVTLTKNGSLRGCIGTLQATQELWKDVQKNALNAAFYDYRFAPLTESELPEIKIEVSVLFVPKKLEFKNEKDLLNKINKNMGIILRRGPYEATFLPQVWFQIPDKVEFLEHLSLKAGLSKDSWKDPEIKILYYTVNAEQEK